MNLLEGEFEERLRKSISFAWQVFGEKIGNGSLQINKEASMQLHYSCLLQQMMPFICFHENQRVEIKLETGVEVNGGSHEIDLVLEGVCSDLCYKIAVEMKCYRMKTSSGGLRGAQDIFKKDVYNDLSLLEKYCKHAGFNRGVSLVMTDYKNFVEPTEKKGKSWEYFDISNRKKVGDKRLTTWIGGEKVDIRIKNSYEFNWTNKGQFWFLELEGH